MNGYDFWAAVCLLVAGLCCFHWLWRASEPDDPTDAWGDEGDVCALAVTCDLINLDELPLYDRIARNEAPNVIAEAEGYLREAAS